MSTQKVDLVLKLQEIQELAKNLDHKSTKMVDDLCASILVVFSESEKK